MTAKKTTTTKTTSHAQATTKRADVTLLKRPRITEKAATLGQQNIYLFDVAVGASKSEIAKAFMLAYKHKPVKVNVINSRAKSHFRRGVLGFGRRTKKAYIVLPKGVTIDIA